MLQRRFILYGGGLSSGKTVWLCLFLWRLGMQFPENRIAIFRKHLTTLRRTTLVTWQRFVPPESVASWNQSTLTCRLINGSEVMFMEADQSKDPDFEKVRSLELGAYGVDEASEVSADLHPALAGRLRFRPRDVDEREMIRRGLYTSNPKPESWLHERFIRNPNQDCGFVSGTYEDNPNNPPGYIESLRRQMTDKQSARFIEGRWDVDDEPDQLIPWEAIRTARAGLTDATEGRACLGCDVARYGDDTTVILEGVDADGVGVVRRVETYGGRRGRNRPLEPTQTGQRLLTLAAELAISGSSIAVDVVGLGAGTVGRMKEGGIHPVEICGGGKAEAGSDGFAFDNRRSQMLFELARDIKDRKIDLSHIDPEMWEPMAADLASMRYTIDGSCIRVERKDSIKQRTGRSPDFADALAYWNHVRRPGKVVALTAMSVSGKVGWDREDLLRRDPLERHRERFAFLEQSRHRTRLPWRACR